MESYRWWGRHSTSCTQCDRLWKGGGRVCVAGGGGGCGGGSTRGRRDGGAHSHGSWPPTFPQKYMNSALYRSNLRNSHAHTPSSAVSGSLEDPTFAMLYSTILQYGKRLRQGAAKRKRVQDAPCIVVPNTKRWHVWSMYVSVSGSGPCTVVINRSWHVWFCLSMWHCYYYYCYYCFL
jgi:hypothetical protein